MALTSKQAKFVASYQITQDATESAKNAGYSAKNAAPQGCRLLKNKEVLAEIDTWRAKKANEITKADFVDIAMGKFNELETTEPNSPRFLDLAGKALGYTTAQNNDSRPNQTLNVTNININGSENQTELWEMTRKLLGNE